MDLLSLKDDHVKKARVGEDSEKYSEDEVEEGEERDEDEDEDGAEDFKKYKLGDDVGEVFYNSL